eukprot:scaffold12133_cov40-Prasinocladus_malaysianus.AAC.1
MQDTRKQSLLASITTKPAIQSSKLLMAIGKPYDIRWFHEQANASATFQQVPGTVCTVILQHKC